MRTLRVLGQLLAYPSPALITALPECQACLVAENICTHADRQQLDALMQDMASRNLLDVQEDYVTLFDRTPSLSLHMFEHVHGDSRDRGQALAELIEVYNDAGLTVTTTEMPDFLPLFLEFLSTLSADEAKQNLGDIVDLLALLKARLANRKSRYASVFATLVKLAAKKPDTNILASGLGRDKGGAITPTEMDKAWAEMPAFDTASADGSATAGACPKATDMLARIESQTDQPAKKGACR